MNEETPKVFELSKTETRVLFSIENWLIRLDISKTNDRNIADRKTRWLLKWEDGLFKRTFFGLMGENPPNSEDSVVTRILGINDPNKRSLIFCEAMVFAPYFNIQSKETTHLQDTLDEVNRGLWRKNLFFLARRAGVEESLLIEWERVYQDSLRNIGGRSDIWKKAGLVALVSVAFAVTGGLAAPAVGATVGGLMGLSGAAATSAGLAFLGGGAIAAGGFGMAGGTVAVIGGGALLGGVSGLVGSRLFYVQHKVVLSQLAKLEASLSTVLVSHPEFSKLINEVQNQYVATMTELKREVEAKHIDLDEGKKISKSLEYYAEAIHRLHDLRLKVAGLPVR